MKIRHYGVWLVLLTVAGCSRDGTAGERAPSQEATTPSIREATAGEAAAPSGRIDPDLANRGQELFQTKGCIGCHTIGGGKLTGPDLAGVTDRREYEWIVSMVSNPDSMLKVDPVARQLFAQYMTPMNNMGVTTDDVRAIYEFLRREGPQQ